jgi:hypothetical protein
MEHEWRGAVWQASAEGAGRSSSRQPRYSRLANIETTGQVGLAGATVGERIQSLALLMSGKLWRSTHMNPTRLGASSTFPGSGTYQIAFKLGETAKDREHQSAMRRGRVSPNVGQLTEPGPSFGDSVENIEKIAR